MMISLHQTQTVFIKHWIICYSVSVHYSGSFNVNTLGSQEIAIHSACTVLCYPQSYSTSQITWLPPREELTHHGGLSPLSH